MFFLYNVFYFTHSNFVGKIFRNLVSFSMTFDNSSLKKGIYIPRTWFFLRGAFFFKACRLMWKNTWKPSSLLIKFSLVKLFINVSLCSWWEKISCDLAIIFCFRLIIFKTFSHDHQSHQMEIRQPFLYYASTLKVEKYICKNQIYTC